MSGFHVPFSSSPPLTPDRRNKDGTKQYAFSASNPSTTPAGPPPSSAGSFTPAGPPPSSTLGSSRDELRKDDQPFPSLRYSKETVLKPPTQDFSPSNSPWTAPSGQVLKRMQPSGLGDEYKPPAMGRKPGGFSADLYDDDDDEEEEGDYAEDNQHERNNLEENEYSDEPDHNMDDTAGEDDYYDERDLRFDSSGPGPRSSKDYPASQKSNILRRSQEEDLMDFRRSIENPVDSRNEYTLKRIAKDMYSQMDSPPVQESDDLVLGTEGLIIRLYEQGIRASDDEDALQEALAIIPAELLKLWADYSMATSAHISEEYTAAIGPGPRASSFSKANFLASILIQLHHPGLVDSPNRSGSRRLSLQRSTTPLSIEGMAKQTPLVLMEWMDDYHDPYPSQLDEIQGHRPSPANHRLFWDTILNSLLRGRVVAVVNALKTAGWRHARQELDDGRDDANHVGYTGQALANIEKVVNESIQVLHLCPAMRGDWNVRNSDWTLFRLRVDQTLEDLKRFAEGRNRESTLGVSSFNNGRQSYVGTAKKAESQVPWNVYQNLLTMYNLVLGDSNAIVENSQDWCEAAIGLVVWWNPGKDDRRLTISRSRALEEEAHSGVYLKKLADSFYRATSESSDFQVNTLDPVEVGLASIMEGNVEDTIGLLRSWSGPISSASAELAALGGWLPHVESQALIAMDSLDQDDMDVLGLGPQSGKLDSIKDYTLIVYASALADRDQIESTPSLGHPGIIREGWEVAVEVLGRLDSVARSEEEVGNLLHDFPFNSSATVNKLLRLLNDLGMTALAEKVAEEYADSLGENSYKYGEAIWYYSFSHKAKKIKDVLDLLISFSLIHSVAYPPESEMDGYLKRLIFSPKTALTEVSKLDFEAAQLLHTMLSGYATLRKFYELRDEETKAKAKEKPKFRGPTRKLEAASALMAVITSANDNIQGGLYDEARGAVVSVDFLLALLGEALVFVNQPQPALTQSQIITLLKAIEDLQTVAPRVYGACNEFFQTVMASAQGLKGSSPMDLLRKSTSSLSGTSSFSLVGSSMIASQLQRSIGNSGIMVKGNAKRGWDWRKGVSAGTTGEDIIRIIRFGLAKDMARVWTLEADGQL